MHSSFAPSFYYHSVACDSLQQVLLLLPVLFQHAPSIMSSSQQLCIYKPDPKSHCNGKPSAHLVVGGIREYQLPEHLFYVHTARSLIPLAPSHFDTPPANTHIPGMTDTWQCPVSVQTLVSLASGSFDIFFSCEINSCPKFMIHIL